MREAVPFVLDPVLVADVEPTGELLFGKEAPNEAAAAAAAAALNELNECDPKMASALLIADGGGEMTIELEDDELEEEEEDEVDAPLERDGDIELAAEAEAESSK